MIVKRKGGYHVVSEDGSKNLGGPYKSRRAARKRLAQVEYFKHKGKSAAMSIEWVNEFGTTMSVDATGHQHKGKGEGGGQFTKSNNNAVSAETNIKKMVSIQFQNFKKSLESGKYGDQGKEMLATLDEKKFNKNWMKSLKTLEADSSKVSEIQSSINEAYNNYNLPVVPIFIRKLTPEEKAGGENAHWDNGFMVISDDVMEDKKYFSAHNLSSDKKSTVKQAYPDPIAGLVVHELGHKYHEDNEDIITPARIMLSDHTTRKKVANLISDYASTHPKELIAEAYAMRKHPDFENLSDETKELIREVLQEKKQNISLALWATNITKQCLLEAGDDVSAGLEAAEYIINNHVPLSVDDVTLSTNQRRAKNIENGGEWGPNGEFYKAGEFIATVDKPKLKKLKIKGTGKEQWEPYKWSVPDPGKFPIFRFAGSDLSLREGKEGVTYDYVVGYMKQSQEYVNSLEKLVNLWKNGERWANIEDFPLLVRYTDVERLIIAGKPVPKQLLEKFPQYKEYVDDSPSLSINTFFAHDIYNRHAQGILNKALKSVKGLNETARKELTTVLSKTGKDSGEAILKFVEKYRVQLAKVLASTQIAAVLEGAKEVAGKLPSLMEFPGAIPPPPTMDPYKAVELAEKLEQLTPEKQAEIINELTPAEQVYIRQAIAVRNAPPITIPPITHEYGGEGPEGIHFPIIDNAVKTLSERNVMDRPRFDALDAAARAKAFTVANIESDETLTKIRDSLAENVKEGADYETWRKKIMEDMEQGTFLSDAHQETVFRTNVQTGFSDGQEMVLSHPLVRSGFPYRAYDSIHDDRVREDHLALDTAGIGGTNIYRADDPVFQLFRPPWDFNCVPWNSLIHTERGRIPISEVIIGDRVLTHLGRFRNVTAIHRTERATELVTVQLESGSFVRATCQHRILTERGWIECAALNIDDEVYQVTNPSQPHLVVMKINNGLEAKDFTDGAVSVSIGVSGAVLNFNPNIQTRKPEVKPEWECLLIEYKLNSSLGENPGECLLVRTHTNNAVNMFSWIIPDRFIAGCNHLRSHLRSAGCADNPINIPDLFSTFGVQSMMNRVSLGAVSNRNTSSLKHPTDSFIVNTSDSGDVCNTRFLLKVIPNNTINTSGVDPQTCLGLIQVGGQTLWLFSHNYNCNIIPSRIQEISRKKWENPVYNLSVEEDESYVCDGVVAHNCRCSSTALTVRQAAEKGIKEAEQWLETGVEPEQKAFVPMPPFEPRDGFKRDIAGLPLSIQMSMQSLRLPQQFLEEIQLSTDASGHQHKGKGPGGGEFTKGDSGNNENKGTISKVVGSIKHAEHWVADNITKAIAKLPAVIRLPIKGTWMAMMATYSVTNKLAEQVAIERGYDEEQARRLKGVLASIDMVLAKPTVLAGELTGLGAMLGFVPIASAGYLAYSTARNPLATLTAAGKMVASVINNITQIANPQVAAFALGEGGNRIIEALEVHNFDDYYIALFSAALDQVKENNIDAAIKVANVAYEQNNGVDLSIELADDEGDIDLSIDVAGHAHKDKGPGGGQFISKDNTTNENTEAESESSVPIPDEKPGINIQKSYINDARKIAELSWTKERVERLKAKMQSNDERWSKIVESVIKVDDRSKTLEKHYYKIMDKMNKLLDEDLDLEKAGKPAIHTAEMNELGLKADEALDKFLSNKRKINDKAWGIIKKELDNEDRRFHTGELVIRKISFTKEGLSKGQEDAVTSVEKKLSGVITTRLKQRIEETIIRSIPVEEEQRDHFKGTRHNGKDQGVYLSLRTNDSTVAHELGHSLETNANIYSAAQGFLYSRVGAEEAKPMGAGYKEYEVGRDDEFGKAFGNSARYVGKHYKTDDTEVTSMGLEKLYSDPVHFAINDPEYFKFMIGVLDGSFT